MKFLQKLMLFSIFLSINSFSQNNIEYTSNNGHLNTITDAVLSNNNKYLITCGNDKSIILWDFVTEKEILTLTDHKNNISCVDINNDNTQIASGETGKEENGKYVVKIWDLKTKNEINIIKPNVGKILFVKFTDNGENIFIAGEKKIIKYNIKTNKKIKNYIGFKTLLKNVSISSNLKFITANTGSEAYIWDTSKQENIKIIKSEIGKFTSININSNANIITGNNYNIINVFDTIKELRNIDIFKSAISNAIISNDNKIIVAADNKNGYFKLINRETGTEIKTIEAHKGVIGKIKFSNKNNYIITIGKWDKIIKIWNIEGNLIKTFKGIEKNIYQKAYIFNNKYFAVGEYRNRVFINFINKEKENIKFKDKNGEISCVALSNNKKYLAYGTSKNHSKIIDITTQKEKYKFITQKSRIRQIIFSNNDKYLATASFKQLIIWNVETGKQVISINDKFKVPYIIKFNKTDKLIAVGGYNETKIFNIETGKQVNVFKAKEIVYSIDFSNNGQYIAIGEGNKNNIGKYKITIWNLKTNKSEKSFIAHKYKITNIIFNKDDKTLISSGNTNIKFWNIETGKTIKQIKAHKSWINNINFNTDYTKLISVSQDATIKVWNAQTGKLILTAFGIKNTKNWFSFTPDNKYRGTKQSSDIFYSVKDLQITPVKIY